MRAFLQMLNELQDGHVIDDAERALTEVRDHLAKGLPQIPVFVGSWSNQ